MNPILRNVLAVIAGAITAMVVNGVIISLSGSIIPPPEGADVTTTEGLLASIHLFQPKHFIMPFLAHAIGSLLGAMVAALIAASHKIRFAFVIGILHLAGGITAVFMIPSPAWFAVLDLAGAYIPMAYLGGKLAMRKK